MCGRQPEKVVRDRESVWAKIHETVYSRNFDEVIVRAATPIHHAHEPLGMPILARTLIQGQNMANRREKAHTAQGIGT